jgi:TM2 domain-containing membrane protein YozV
MSGASFGRRGIAPEPDMAARRAAFLAEERARAGRVGQSGDPVREGARPLPPAEPIFVREKSAGTAYLLWFILGGLSAHRFYLGFTTSAMIQLAITPLGYALLISKSPAGVAFVLGGALWLLADAFLIPGLTRTANARLRRLTVATVFA